jgi:hypothetical protein
VFAADGGAAPVPGRAPALATGAAWALPDDCADATLDEGLIAPGFIAVLATVDGWPALPGLIGAAAEPRELWLLRGVAAADGCALPAVFDGFGIGARADVGDPPGASADEADPSGDILSAAAVGADPAGDVLGRADALGGDALAGDALAGDALAGDALAGDALAGDAPAGDGRGSPATSGAGSAAGAAFGCVVGWLLCASGKLSVAGCAALA